MKCNEKGRHAKQNTQEVGGISIPKSSASKTDEIKFLNKLAAAIPENTYLKDLFNPKLLEFFAHQVKCDFPPDVMDLYNNAIDENGRLGKTLTNLQTSYRRLEDELKRAQEQIASLKGEIDSLQNQIQQERDDKQDLKERIFHLNNLVARYEEQAKQYRATIYILEHPEENLAAEREKMGI